MQTRPDWVVRLAERTARLGLLLVELAPAGARSITPDSGDAAILAASIAARASNLENVACIHVDLGGTPAVVMALAPDWLDSGALHDASRVTGIPYWTLRAACVPFASFTPPAVRVAFQAFRELLAECSETSASNAEHEGVIASFTDELSKSYETLTLLYSIGNGLSDLNQPERFLGIAIDRLQAGSDFATVAVRFADLSTGTFNRVLTAGRDPSQAARAGDLTLNLPTDHAAYTGGKRVVPPGKLHPDRQVLVQPLILDGSFLGYLTGTDKGGTDPLLSSYDLQLFQATGSFLAAFLKTCSLFEEQRQMFVGTVKAMTAAIDAKDRYTRGHSERVAWLSAALARALGLPEEEVRRIHVAGLVHDVGKIGVPEAVLCKPGRLTDEEFGWIKKHPQIGHTILSGIPLLADILPGVLHHHERFDGKGYPNGLSGESIPRMARIISVADTFDALSSTRSYRAARPRDVVLAEIARSAGSQLDPEIAGALAKVDLTEFDRLLAEHATTAPAVSIVAA